MSAGSGVAELVVGLVIGLVIGFGAGLGTGLGTDELGSRGLGAGRALGSGDGDGNGDDDGNGDGNGDGDGLKLFNEPDGAADWLGLGAGLGSITVEAGAYCGSGNCTVQWVAVNPRNWICCGSIM